MLLIALALGAAAFEDLDALNANIAGAAALGHAVAMPVDPRLRLARCPEGVQIEAAGAAALTVRCHALGWRLRVRLLSELRAAPVMVVRKGDALTVRSEGSGFVVETVGTAAEDGAIGQTVKITLDGANRTTTGVVSSRGQVLVGALNLSGLPTLPYLQQGPAENAIEERGQ